MLRFFAVLAFAAAVAAVAAQSIAPVESAVRSHAAENI